VQIPRHRATDEFPTRSLSVFHFSTGRRIGLSPLKRVVAGSSPAFGTGRRSSSVVEHVSQFVSYPSVFSAGREMWVTDCRLRFKSALAFTRVAQPGRATVKYPHGFWPAYFFRWAEDIGLSVIGSIPICSIRRGSSSVGRANPASSLARLNFLRGACRDDSTATLNPGDRMANHIHESQESNFEITSKRRKGFPSETRVKRGIRIVHGFKELSEKLGRNDPCPCGSGRSF
jgi:hypothetical protein